MSQVVVARADAIAHDAPASDGSFRVLTENLLALTADIERLGPRAARLGTARLALRDTGRCEGRHAFVMLEGEAPALLGWTLAAIVDHRHDASAIRSIVPWVRIVPADQALDRPKSNPESSIRSRSCVPARPVARGDGSRQSLGGVDALRLSVDCR